MLKTTMIVESHWRKLKHDYLHRFNRPRVDLVVWVLASRVIPQTIDRMRALIIGNHRKGNAAWRKAFKRQWDSLQNCEVEPQDLQTYHTSPSKWTCACSKFLLSRFLICEHIVSCFEKISDRPKFFSNVRRQRQTPFWTDEQLLLRPEHRALTIDTLPVNEDAESEIRSGSENNFSNNEDVNLEDEGENSGLEESDDGLQQLDLKEDVSTIKAIGVLLEEQLEIGNNKFLEVYLNNKSDVESDRTLIDEIQQRKRQRTMPATWSRNKHPATMYYK